MITFLVCQCHTSSSVGVILQPFHYRGIRHMLLAIQHMYYSLSYEVLYHLGTASLIMHCLEVINAFINYMQHTIQRAILNPFPSNALFCYC